jgi:anti-anti-sigma factor
MGDRAGGVVVHVPGELTLRVAPSFAQALHERLTRHPASLLIDLEHVKIVDVVGLAALVQGLARARARGVEVGVAPSPVVHQALLDARLLEVVPLFADRPRSAKEPCVLDEPSGRPDFVACTREFGLRPPGWDDLPLFERWARDPHLDKMVGSDLLYRCRHLGAYQPAFANQVLYHPTSLTLLVESTATTPQALGFLRIFGVNLVHGYAFLETAITSMDALRKGWGVTAARLLVAYAWDVLGVRRIEARVFEYNRLSANTLKRNGFQQEGVLRKAVFAEGFHWDILVFSILEHEMREQRQREKFPSMGLWPATAASESEPP